MSFLNIFSYFVSYLNNLIYKTINKNLNSSEIIGFALVGGNKYFFFKPEGGNNLFRFLPKQRRVKFYTNDNLLLGSQY
jgi:hypothetical protein